MNNPITLDPLKLLGFKMSTALSAKMGSKNDISVHAPTSKLGQKPSLVLPGAKLGQKDY